MSNTTILYKDNKVTIDRVNLNSIQDKLILTIKIDTILLHSTHDIITYTHAYYVNDGMVLLNNIDNQIKYKFKIYNHDLVASDAIKLDDYVNKNILSRSTISKVIPKQLKKIDSNKYSIVFKIVIVIPKSINNDNIAMIHIL